MRNVISIGNKNYQENGKFTSEGAERISRILTPGILCLISEENYDNRRGTGVSKPFKLFHIGEKGVYKFQESLAVDIERTENPFGKVEKLVVNGSFSSEKGIDSYSISNERRVLLFPQTSRGGGEYRENTFSPRGGENASWFAFSGTTAIDYRKKLRTPHERSLDDLAFRQGALEVSIPASYLPSIKNRSGDEVNGEKGNYTEEGARVFAITKIAEAISNLSQDLLNESLQFSLDVEREREHPNFSKEYFCRGREQNPEISLRNARGYEGRIWVKPENSAGMVVVQALPYLLKEQFPEERVSPSLKKQLTDAGNYLAGKKIDFSRVPHAAKTRRHLKFLK